MWLSVINFPNYELNKNAEFRNKNTGLILKHIYTRRYPSVNLYNSNGSKSLSIHRLIAEHYIPNPNNYPYVNHIDGNKLNNSITNLEWCTPKQNNDHAITMGLQKVVGEENGCSKLTDEQVSKIKYLLSIGTHQRVIGKQFGVSQTLVHFIKRGKLWKHIE